MTPDLHTSGERDWLLVTFSEELEQLSQKSRENILLHLIDRNQVTYLLQKQLPTKRDKVTLWSIRSSL